jgi:uncharacterized protein involved in exopolysaccharide biosynthesis/Mrp family chromosome partitioning ATPase
MTPSRLKTELDAEFGYGQLLAILLRRRFWLLSVWSGVVAIATLITLFMKPTYESQMQLLIEPNLEDSYRERLGEERQPTPPSQPKFNVDYATQLNLMRSSQFLEGAVNLLRSEYPDLDAAILSAQLTLMQVVEEDVNTRIFQATYTDSDPLKSQKILQALQKVYQDYNLAQENLRITQGLAVINKQLPEARESFLKAQKALEQFRQKENLVNPEQQATAIAQELRTVEQERQAIEAQHQGTQARYNDLQQQLSLSPQKGLKSARLSESPRYQDLLKEVQNTELALAQQRVIFTDASPQVQDLLEKRQSQLALLHKEMKQVLGGVATQPNTTGEAILKEGRLGETELALVGQLVEAEAELLDLSARDRSLLTTEQKLRTQMSRFPNLIAQYDRLQPEVEIQRETIKQLLAAQQELTLELARGGFKWQVVEAPQLGEKISPSLRINLMLGMVVGLFLGAIVAFVREALDDTIHSEEELKSKLDLPLIAIVPEFSQIKVRSNRFNFSSRHPQTSQVPLLQVVNWLPFREAIDLAYKKIQLLNSVSELRSILITSAQTGEGKSTLALGLALSAARLRKKVLLIDVNLRRPILHELFALPNEQGFSTLLSSLDMPKPHRVSVLGVTIEVLTAGPEPDDPVRLLNSQRMGKLIGHFEHSYDLVLLDASPILGTPEFELENSEEEMAKSSVRSRYLELTSTRVGTVDVLQTASFCHGVLMVARINQITSTELLQAREILGKLNTIGVIANGAKIRNSNAIAYIDLKRDRSLDLPQPLIEPQNSRHN